MDDEFCASRDSIRRNVDLAGAAGGTMDVIPLEMYDSARAKIAANLRWLFAKAYGIDHIPEDLRDPFYTDQYDQEHIKPPVIRLLLSCELYCRVCTLILKTEQAASLQSHLSVIQALSRKGIYVVESDDTRVTEEDLACVPVKMSAHMPMIDALMMAYTVEMISIEKVVASVKRFSTFSASKELPFDLEDAMVFWINKVNLKMREVTEREHKVKQHPLESPSHQKMRYRREHPAGHHLSFPLVEDLMRDVCDGAALLIVVHYYCPDIMKLEDIHLKEVPSIADSLYNIHLLKEYANEYLNKSFYLTTEDMLYSPLVLKHNVMVFIAELFWWLETVKPEFVQPRDLQEFKDARSVAQPKSARPTVPISNATKRSFLVSPTAADNQSIPEVCNRYFLHPEDPDPLKGGPAFSPPHPLLPLRQRQQRQQGDESSGLRNRSNSLTQVDGQPRASVAAWPDKRQRPVSTLSSFMLHAATDSDADVASGDSVSLARSISKDSLASNITISTPKHQAAVHQSVPGTVRKVNGHTLLGNVNIEDKSDTLVAAARDDCVAMPKQADTTLVATAAGSKPYTESKPATDHFYLEPLMPAQLKTAKERSVCLNKEEESGEGSRSSGRGILQRGDGSASVVRRKTPFNPNQTFASQYEEAVSEEPPNSPAGLRPTFASTTCREPAGGFNLYADADQPTPVQDLDAELEDLDEKEDDLDEAYTTAVASWPRKAVNGEDEEEESAKLQDDMNIKEHEDKDMNNGSGRSSPCLSTESQSSSMASNGVRMTSFAERKFQQHRFGSNQDLRSSASSSQRTTPDGSESSGPLSSSWRLRRDQSPSPRSGDGCNVLASELVQLRMQLEEKRRAIEHQKRKMEVLSARQRQKLGKAAFLHIIKKGGGRSDTLPNPIKAKTPTEELNVEKVSKDDICVDAITAEKEVAVESALSGALEAEKKGNGGSFYLEEELDLNECNRSIELLNDAIGSIQQQMMQLSLQQELLIKQNVPSLSGAATSSRTGDKNSDSKSGGSAQYVEHLTGTNAALNKKPFKPPSGRSTRSKPSELKISKEQSRHTSRTLTTNQSGPEAALHQRHPRNPTTEDAVGKPGSGNHRGATFRLNDEANVRLPSRVDHVSLVDPKVLFDDCNSSDISRKENNPSEQVQRSKAHLIEVDLSDLKASEDEGTTEDAATEGGDGEQKSGLGFFFKDEQKAEDELAKKRAAFLQKQQKKAEETRLRKQQLEAESELKRDEARRKAEEERQRKEDEKTRRELIKQEYLRKKQQEMLEEQGMVKPKAPKPQQKHRPKTVLREESSSDNFSKGSSLSDNLSTAQSGSSLSLASAATNEADSVNSGGAGSQRCDSVESFPGHRNNNQAAERDWDNGSAASSIASLAEYTGPKLFKGLSTKSNKTIIHNAISYCCLAGKVNEPLKNQILKELENTESNHLIILFRDASCKFRALYSYFPDTEEIHKLTGIGPKCIGKKMIDKLYKYNSDRKQFTIIPAKTVSVSVDAFTIHNHLWQPKRVAVPKNTAK